MGPTILAQTDTIVACDKPAGLSTTGHDLDDPNCLQYRLMEHFDQPVWALHQLDRHTSGVVLFSLKKSAVHPWQSDWREGVDKIYVALVHGVVSQATMTIDAPIRRINDDNAYTTVAVDEGGKRAVTDVARLSTGNHYSLILARLRTGRTHQIRAHLQHAGHPLIGEKKYNQIPCAHHDRQALHALAIWTDHAPPLDELVAPLADDLKQVASRLSIPLDELNNWRRAARACAPPDRPY